MPTDDVTALVALALSAAAPEDLLTRATELAATTRDRQIVAIATAYVAGLTSNARYRTNLGFVAGTTSGMTVEISLRDREGATIGTRTFTIVPNGFEHLQFSSQLIAAKTFDEASATFRIVSGNGALAPYASVIDNMSNGAFFISSQFPPGAPFASSISIFHTLFDRLRDDR